MAALEVPQLDHIAYAWPGQPAELRGVTPGDYSLCAVPAPVDLKDEEASAELLPYQGALPVHCEPLAVKAGGDERAITVRAAAVPSLEELEEASRAAAGAR